MSKPSEPRTGRVDNNRKHPRPNRLDGEQRVSIELSKQGDGEDDLLNIRVPSKMGDNKEPVAGSLCLIVNHELSLAQYMIRESYYREKMAEITENVSQDNMDYLRALNDSRSKMSPYLSHQAIKPYDS